MDESNSSTGSVEFDSSQPWTLYLLRDQFINEPVDRGRSGMCDKDQDLELLVTCEEVTRTSELTILFVIIARVEFKNVKMMLQTIKTFQVNDLLHCDIHRLSYVMILSVPHYVLSDFI